MVDKLSPAMVALLTKIADAGADGLHQKNANTECALHKRGLIEQVWTDTGSDLHWRSFITQAGWIALGREFSSEDDYHLRLAIMQKRVETARFLITRHLRSEIAMVHALGVSSYLTSIEHEISSALFEN